eukprot:4014026-Prymnesium_polylepis.1
MLTWARSADFGKSVDFTTSRGKAKGKAAVGDWSRRRSRTRNQQNHVKHQFTVKPSVHSSQ